MSSPPLETERKTEEVERRSESLSRCGELSLITSGETELYCLHFSEEALCSGLVEEDGRAASPE